MLGFTTAMQVETQNNRRVQPPEFCTGSRHEQFGGTTLDCRMVGRLRKCQKVNIVNVDTRSRDDTVRGYDP